MCLVKKQQLFTTDVYDATNTIQTSQERHCSDHD